MSCLLGEMIWVKPWAGKELCRAQRLERGQTLHLGDLQTFWGPEQLPSSWSGLLDLVSCSII